MKLSARNALKVDIGGQTITSLVSVEAIDDLALKIGDNVQAIIKSSEVIIGK